MKEGGKDTNIKINLEGSLYQKYNSLMTYATQQLFELINDHTPLSEKATRRMKELCDRRESILQVWVGNMAKSKSSEEKIEKYSEIITMLNELLDDITKFEAKKLSL